MADHKKIATANIQFTKAQRVEEAKKAMAEYEADAVAVRAKTERLKALRLAKEASEGTTPEAPAAPAPAKRKTSKKSKEKPATLSAWLKGQAGFGRNN